MIRTKGNVIVDNIKNGDIHYEFEYGLKTVSQVIEAPKSETRDTDVYWSWKSKNLLSDEVINYGVSDKYSHYGPNLYDYEAYIGCKQV